jgi:thioesterase domain-containing protein
MGIDSLMSVELRNRIQVDLGQEIPMAAFFQYSTASALAEYLSRQGEGTAALTELAPAPTVLVPMQAGDPTRQLLFLIAPAGGSVSCYTNLVQQLDPGQPCFGLGMQSLDASSTTAESVQRIAARYVKVLRTAQPEGPFCLCGWSMGGVVAFEMARQLQAQGPQVAPLVLIDSPALTDHHKLQEGEEALLLGFALSLGVRWDDISSVRERLKRMEPGRRMAYLLEQAREMKVLPLGTGLDQLVHLFNVFKHDVELLKNYTPQPYSGSIMLFKAEEQLIAFDFDMGWTDLAKGGLTIRVVPGDHYTIMHPPQVAGLAEQLRQYLQASRKEQFLSDLPIAALND